VAKSCHPGLTPEQEDRIKRAVESTCELCREYLPFSHLLPHVLRSRHREKNTCKEREKNLIVVCDACERLITGQPVPEEKLRARIAARPFSVRREILLALGYVPKPISPPEDPDLARVYDDTLKEFAGHYR
jgi:hypothetical protein